MKHFACQNCGQPLYFETTRCESCGLRTGYDPQRHDLLALEPVAVEWRPPDLPDARYRFCQNAEHEACNWLVPAEASETFCTACRHNRTIPDLSMPDNLRHWRRIEQAKHRLFYTLLRLRLPLTQRPQDPNGLAFDLLSGSAGPSPSPVMTGHAGGLITLNVAEADDSERERVRHAMGEPYRTLLGHFRHETAHYYWDHLVGGTPAIEGFRELFGDERADYGLALERYYAEGPPPDWDDRFITAYASAHPWEDFAETWAHYFHMVDTLETAAEFGLRLRPRRRKGVDLTAAIDFDPHGAAIDRIVDAWLPLTFAVNSINRSMGLHDLYPFVLSPTAIAKLAFVHERIRSQAGRATAPDSGLQAMIAGLRRRASPRR